MASDQHIVMKLREERVAREKARIEKLREMNLKKYNKEEVAKHSNTSVVNKAATSGAISRNKCLGTASNSNRNANKTNIRPSSVPLPTITKTKQQLPLDQDKRSMVQPKLINTKIVTNIGKANKTVAAPNKEKLVLQNVAAASSKSAPSMPSTSRMSFAPNPTVAKTSNVKKISQIPKKSTQPMAQPTKKPDPSRQSVFERLYKPKQMVKKPEDKVQKLQTNPEYFNKVLKQADIILNINKNRRTTFAPKFKPDPPLRRSISAVHFKRVSKNELGNCFHKWSSVSQTLNKDVEEVSEDHCVREDKIVSAVKSDRKKVTFETPLHNYNMPRPEELQMRLKEWLQKRGKAIDSYHHLQCFGLHHVQQKIKPFDLANGTVTVKNEFYEEENKENIAFESDSDDGSYHENMNENAKEMKTNFALTDTDKWRRASAVSDSVEMNDTQETLEPLETTVYPEEVNVHHEDELLEGALNDLTELLREGFPWEQCARWLRLVRERRPGVVRGAPYWECRGALEERRGDLPASLSCWQRALAHGAQPSVADANLDQLLVKFMQLNIDPEGDRGPQGPGGAGGEGPGGEGGESRPRPRLVDVKNVFKSTIIRFAVQQARLRQSTAGETPQYTVTPVRRSGRLSVHAQKAPTPGGKRTPLRVCESVRQAGALAPAPPVFVPNKRLRASP